MSASDASDAHRQAARQLARDHLARGNFLEWFERLYAEARGDPRVLPWAHLTVNPNLAAWLQRNPLRGDGRRAAVIGCGLGDDAEALAGLGFSVTAFDIAPTAIEWCRRRFPSSSVDYRRADLLQPPAEWSGAFDFVFEAYTLQSLPPAVQETALRSLAGFLAPGGMLLVICRARDLTEPADGPPWPLAREQLMSLESFGLRASAVEDYLDAENPPVRRFRVLFRRARPLSV